MLAMSTKDRSFLTGRLQNAHDIAWNLEQEFGLHEATTIMEIIREVQEALFERTTPL